MPAHTTRPTAHLDRTGHPLPAHIRARNGKTTATRVGTSGNATPRHAFFMTALIAGLGVAALLAAPAINPQAGVAQAAERPLAERPLPVIRVQGKGDISIAPDMAVVTLSVVREAETARAALDANSAAMAEVIGAMKAEDIASKDLQTSGFSIQPRYYYPPRKNNGESDPPHIVGHTVTNNLTVRIRDLDKVGAILDKAVTHLLRQNETILIVEFRIC